MSVVPRGLAPESIDGTIASRRDDPARGTGRHPTRRPPLDGCEKRVLHCLLGDVDVAEETNEHRYRAAVLLPKNAFDSDQRLASLNGRTSIGSVVIRAMRDAHVSAASRSDTSMMVTPPRNSFASA